MTSISAAILAGGKSSRMGRDKATLELAGMPLALHVARALREVSPSASRGAISTEPQTVSSVEPVLVIKYNRKIHPSSPSPQRGEGWGEGSISLGLPIVTDIFPQSCALSGLHAALTHATTSRVLIATCDQPFLEPALLRELIRAPGDIVIGRTGAPFDQPFPGVYSRKLIGVIEDLLREGCLSFQQGLFRRVAPTRLPLNRVLRLDPDLRSYHNLNTPAAMREAQSA